MYCMYAKFLTRDDNNTDNTNSNNNCYKETWSKVRQGGRDTDCYWYSTLMLMSDSVQYRQTVQCVSEIIIIIIVDHTEQREEERE